MSVSTLSLILLIFTINIAICWTTKMFKVSQWLGAVRSDPCSGYSIQFLETPFKKSWLRLDEVLNMWTQYWSVFIGPDYLVSSLFIVWRSSLAAQFKTIIDYMVESVSRLIAHIYTLLIPIPDFPSPIPIWKVAAQTRPTQFLHIK